MAMRMALGHRLKHDLLEQQQSRLASSASEVRTSSGFAALCALSFVYDPLPFPSRHDSVTVALWLLLIAGEYVG